MLRRPRFLHGRESSTAGIKDILWFTPRGTEKTSDEWRDGNARCLGLLLNGRAGSYAAPDGTPVLDDPLLICFNAHYGAVPFTLPVLEGGTGWRCLLDTAFADGSTDDTPLAMGQPMTLSGRSLRMFALIAADEDSAAVWPALAYQPPEPAESEDEDVAEGC